MRRLSALILAWIFLWGIAVGQEIEKHPEEVPDSTLTPAEALRAKAEAGDTEAMNYLGYLLISGEEETPRDVMKGLMWLAHAASSGDVKAASNLGWLYLQGDVVEQNMEEAVKWISKASEGGLPVAKSILGDLYRDGRGVPQDTVAADSLYREAFELGLRDAGFKLYDLNQKKYAAMTPQEKVAEGKYYYLSSAPSEGVKLFYMAADEGDAEAMALLGDAYTRAIGVPYDHSLSLKYYVEGARAGDPSAMFVVGELLEIFPDALKGNEEWKEVSEDPYYWYEKAAEEGVTDAVTATERLFK